MDTEDRGLSSLSDLLKGNTEADAPVEAVETPPPEAAPPPPEAAAALDEPKGDEAAPPAANDSRTVPLSALEKVRAEAKTAKDRIAELEAKLNAPPQAKQAPLDPVTTDPEVYAFAQRAQMSEMVMRSQKPDYDAVIGAYGNAVRSGDAPPIPPHHVNPAQFAYEWGRKVQRLTELGSLDDLEARLRQKWDDEIKAVAAQQKADAAAQLAAQIMPTSAGVRSAAPRDEEGKFTGPTPIADLLPKKAKR